MKFLNKIMLWTLYRHIVSPPTPQIPAQPSSSHWVLSLTLLLGSILTPVGALAGRNEWRTVGKGIEFREVTIVGPSFFSATLALFRISLEHNRISILRAATQGKVRTDVQTLVQGNQALLGVNANFFIQDGSPLGLVISRGILHNKLHHGGLTLTGVLQAGLATPRIVSRAEFKPEGVAEAVQAGPILIRGGKAVTKLRDTTSHSRRAGVCLDDSGHLIIFCTTTGLLGVTLGQLQEALLRPDIGCSEALNFDGGGSAQLYAEIPAIQEKEDPEANHHSEAIPLNKAEPTPDASAPRTASPAQGTDFTFTVRGTDEVPVALGIFPKVHPDEPEPYAGETSIP